MMKLIAGKEYLGCQVREEELSLPCYRVGLSRTVVAMVTEMPGYQLHQASYKHLGVGSRVSASKGQNTEH